MERLGRVLWPRLASGVLMLTYLEVLRSLAGAPLRIVDLLARWLFVQGVLEGALWVGRIAFQERKCIFSWRSAALCGAFIVSLLVYVLTAHTVAAWVVSATFYVLVLAVSSVCQEWPWLVRLIGWGALAMVGALLPAAAGQIESRFSEEEFFAALQVIVLTILTGLGIVARFWIVGRGQSVRDLSTGARRSLSVPTWGVVAGVIVLVCAGGGTGFWAYRHSFYPTQAPTFPGISPSSPFLCGQGVPDPARPDGKDIFRRLLARVESNPQGTAKEFGMLALATGEPRWAEAFRQSILDDVLAAQYAGPANSVKAGQYEAARRAYYLPRLVEAFPDLFSQQEQDVVREWLTAVNRRALTVEWVDWLYALAFSYWPMGPYENQEIGAGLLALLEDHQLTDGTLSARNTEYLARNQRGWFERFRNTDDAYIYQPLWIENALFQLEYWERQATGLPEVARNRALGFEWLLLQALPDGAPLGDNHPARTSFASHAYLGAKTLDDPRYVWWSARLLDWAEKTGEDVFAVPGLDEAVPLTGVSPTAGSCLMFGESGLPTQRGPLAPDKVVFRDGWASDSHYLLLNLRFSGWHRYKATNTVTLLHQGGPLVVEQDQGAPFSWLPVGRSAFRDKRIPRENLNGLLVPRTGMASVLYELTGLGGPWAQDPPHYAQVIAFETGDELDWAHTRVTDWRGWRHDRWIYFYHDGGPVVVVDEAVGPPGSSVALAWHMVGKWALDGQRIHIDDGAREADVLFVPVGWGEGEVELREEQGGGSDWRVRYHAPEGGRLRVATLFLLGRWSGAEASWRTEEGGLWISQGEEHIRLPWPERW